MLQAGVVLEAVYAVPLVEHVATVLEVLHDAVNLLLAACALGFIWALFFVVIINAC